MAPEPREGFDPDEVAPWEEGRRLKLVSASSMEVKPVHWLWNDRIPLGELTLLAGREGIGKSSIAYTLVAWITTGTMKGRYLNEPRNVIVAATEDSWEHTILPRLMAAEADLDRVYRVDVTEDGVGGFLTLPSDVAALREVVENVEAALVLLDPLMSRLSAHLDSHKDQEVRVALEPLTAFAKAARVAVLGIIHVNKSNNTDPLTLIMGSRAFSAVARAVLFACKNPEEDGTNIVGLAKSNLGPKDQPTYCYRIVGQKVAETDEGDVWTGKVDWLGKSDRSVEDVMATAEDGGGVGGLSAVDEASRWLEDYLESEGGSKESSIVKEAGLKAGHRDHNLQRAAKKLKVVSRSEGFPRRTIWSLAADHPVWHSATSRDSSVESVSTVVTVATGDSAAANYQVTSSRDSRDSRDGLQKLVATAETGS